ncbi:hypothetical protein [uncultured Serinicoccus sp.]|uniref:hypothetical protein n=1 Tax=uncultured Serinicoccus sp. TaxID=735514 RepID=UPI0026039EEC|nr:hypothetical protein [uncultured Serinicoccus sp.]
MSAGTDERRQDAHDARVTLQGEGEDVGTGGAPGGGARRPGRRHTRGRVVAPPTNPAADQTDDPPTPDRREREMRRTGDGAAATRLDPRDSWILEQRPPHWD